MLAWFLRMVRSYAKTECGKEYIEAARIAGASGLRIVLRHLIPNVFPQFVVYFTTGIATAIMSVSSFAFLGVGLIVGTPEWGAMLNEARNSVYSNPALLIYPASASSSAVQASTCWARGCGMPLGRRMIFVLLEVKDLNISLASGKCVAEHISFRLGQGEMLSIVGSSGAGKTTICKAIMGLLGNTYRADGEILFQGEDLLDLPERERQIIYGKEICMIMQNPMTAFNPSIRVGRQMEKTYLLHHGKTPRQEMQRLFAAILQKLGLEDTQRILNSYPFTLSGGMLQRLMIAAALMCQPSLLVADEATTAIDACNRIG